MKNPDRRDDDIRAEIEFHLETEQEEQEGAGVGREQARRAALRGLGNATLLAETIREVWSAKYMETLVRDIRYAFRTMRKDLGFTIAALLCLTLGIGANTAVFSCVNAYLLQSLPYRDPGRLVAIFEKRPREANWRNVVSYADFFDWRDQSRSFAAVGGHEGAVFNYTGSGEPERVAGAFVTASFFDALGVRPWRGRVLDQQDEVPGGSGVVITHGFWQRHFGSNEGIIGQSIVLDGRPQPILGILPPDFVPPGRGWKVFMPMRFSAEARNNRGNHSLFAIARLKPDVSLGQAAQDLAVISKRLEEAHAVNKGHYANVVPLSDALRGDVKPAMLVLLVAVGLVLLIACFNVANLLLARSVTRAREISLRLALGGGRLRIVRQLLTESLMLSLSGAALGVAGAFAGVRYMRSILPPHSNIGPEDLRVDLPVLVFTTGVALLAALLFGVAPALSATGGSLVDWIKSAGRQHSGSAWHRRQRSAILTLQTGIAVLLLIGAGLLLRSFWMMKAVNPGFRPENLVAVQMSLPAAYRENARKIAFQRQALEQVRALPGVLSAGFTSFLPFTDQNSRMGFVIDGIPPDPNDEPRRANWRLVTPGYVEAMKIPVLRGRAFEEGDQQGAPLVMLVNDAAARRYWPGRDPIGSRARLSTMKDFAVVIGVIGDVKHWGLEESSRPEAYLSSYQAPFSVMNLIVRTEKDPVASIAAVREKLRSIDRNVPAVAARTMEDLISNSTSSRRFLTRLVLGFALLALVLAAGGTFAQVAYTVSQRSHEIGIRMALGASRQAVVALMMRQVLALIACGGILAIAATSGVAGLFRKVLFGIEPLDGPTLAVAPLLMLAVAALACYLPSLRAARINPADALRAE